MQTSETIRGQFCHLDSARSESERGSVESGLVLIPTTLFFLVALQLLLAGSWQTIERARLHDIVIESSIRESVGGGSNSVFEGESTYLRGGANEGGLNHSLNVVSLTNSTSLHVQNKFTPIGELRTFEMKTELPILGRLFQTIDGGIFYIKNYAVSFVS